MSTVETPLKTQRSFFTVGGTLPANAPSYVERKADTNLFAHLMEGQFCYVLTSRQVGKSSLMVRTALRLREAGRRVAVLDLTKVGMNLSAEQWYDGLLVQLGREFDLEDELDDFWIGSDAAVQRMGPMQRWMTALRKIILPLIPGHLVIFIDEIDAVRGLPFATDEFFAGIRQVYNNRTEDPELTRLTFCLIGVATPADLIRNVSTTPFNIGNRVVLTDFTEQEAEPLIHGLGREPVVGFRLLRRILWWTNGHPYLTQRLCATVAADPKVDSPRDVDRVCDELFLSARARESDDNLLFVRERILRKRSDAELSGLLDLYGLVHAGKQVAADDNNPLIDILRLAGLVTARDNRLVVRNRIYGHVFDERWIRMNMPDAELRRQRAAYHKGVLRTVGLGVLVLLVIAGLVIWRAIGQQKTAMQDYAGHVIQVQQSFDSGDYAAGVEAMREAQAMVRTQPHWLERQIDKSRYLNRHLMPYILRHPALYAVLNGFDQKVDARFEWNYLRARLFGDGAFFYMGNRDEIRSVAISPNGRWLATGSADSTVRIFDIGGFNAASANHPILKCALAVLYSPANTPAGAQSYYYLPRGTNPGWSVNRALDRHLRQDLGLVAPSQNLPAGLKPWAPPGILSVAFSPDGAWLAIGTGSWNTPQVPGTVYLWSTTALCSGSAQVIPVPTHYARAVDTVAFRSDSQELAGTSEDNTAEFWSILPGGGLQSRGTIDASSTTTKGMNAAAFSPSGRTFAMAFGDGHFCTAAIGADGSPRPDCRQPTVADVSGLMSMAWYDDNLILLGTRDGRVAPVALSGTPPPAGILETGQGLVTSLTFSSDRKLLLTTGSDGTVRVWPLIQDEHRRSLLLGYGDSQMLRGAKSVVYSAAMTAHGRLIVSGGADTVSGATDGRLYFWTLQPKPDGQPDPTAGVVTTPLVKMICGDGQLGMPIQPTWSSQPAFLRTCGAVQAVAYSPSGDEVAGIVGVSRRDGLQGQQTGGEHPATIFIQRLAMSQDDATQYKAMKAGVVLDPNTKQPIPPPKDPDTGKWLYPEKPVGDPLLLRAENQQSSVIERENGVALAWSADGRYLAAAENDRNGYCGTVELWDASGNSSRYIPLIMPPVLRQDCDSSDPPAVEHDTVQDLAFLPSGILVAALNHTDSHGSHALIVFWNVASPGEAPQAISMSLLSYRDPSGETIRPYGANFTLNKLAFSADGGDSQWMAVCGSRNAVQVWDLPPALWDRNASPASDALTLGQLSEKSLKLTKNLTGAEYASRRDSPGGLQGQCSAIALSPDSRWLAAGTRSYEVAVWSTRNWLRVEGQKITSSLVETGDQKNSNPVPYYVPSPPLANATVNAIVFSPDNRRLAYGTADSKINLWHVVAQTPLPVVSIHSGGVLSLAFSPNDVCLASGSSDQTLRLTCEVDPLLLEKVQPIHFTSAQAPSVPAWRRWLQHLHLASSPPSTAVASDRAENDNWVQFAQ